MAALRYSHSGAAPKSVMLYNINRISLIQTTARCVGCKHHSSTVQEKNRRISCTLGRFVIAIRIPVVLQPLHHLLHLTVPIRSKDNQATDTTGEHQSDRETNPESPELHILPKGKVDAHRDTNDIIGTNEGKHRMSVLESGFGEGLHEVKEGAGCLSALCA